MKIIIETERLVLKEINMQDSAEMLKLYTNKTVLKYTGESPISTLSAMESAIALRIENYKKYGFGRWATFIKGDNRFIGWAGLDYLPEFNEVDLGYRFLPKFWKKGYATEASKAIINYGFSTLKLQRIIAIAMKDNKVSIRVMQKIGMHFYKFAPYEIGSEDAVWYYLNTNMR